MRTLISRLIAAGGVALLAVAGPMAAAAQDDAPLVTAAAEQDGAALRTLLDEGVDVNAARADGAGDIRILWHIIIPLSRSVLSAIAILSFLGTFNDFLWPLVMIDDRDMFTLPLVLRIITNRQATREDQVLAAAVMSITPILIFFIIFQRHIVKGIALTGLKG